MNGETESKLKAVEGLTLHEVKLLFIQETLDRLQSKRKAAASLGISIRGLSNLIRRYDLKWERFKR